MKVTWSQSPWYCEIQSENAEGHQVTYRQIAQTARRNCTEGWFRFWAGWSCSAQDFIMLPRMACHLKLRNFLFLEFPTCIFRPQLWENWNRSVKPWMKGANVCRWESMAFWRKFIKLPCWLFSNSIPICPFNSDSQMLWVMENKTMEMWPENINWDP